MNPFSPRRGEPRRPARLPRALPLTFALALGLSACGGGGGGDDGGGGGIVGTGIQLRGTVADNRRLAVRELEVRAASGERSIVAIGADGTFAASDLAGSGPFLLRAAFGDGEAWYALTRVGGDGPMTANVHAYTDLALRNVVAMQGGSIDELFDASGALAADQLPDVDRVGAVNAAIGDILAASLQAYDLAGTNLTNVPFTSDGQGVDRFLEENPVVVEDDTFTILATDPVTDTRTTVSDKVELTRDLLAADTMAPGAPGELRALPATSDEIVLVWTAATDDVAVTRYEVSRDGQTVATTPYPVFSDAPLAGGTDYSYTVVAIDEAGNRSTPTSAAVASPLAAPDTTPPPTPTDVQVSVTLESARVSWTQTGISDVAAFRVLRSVGDAMLDTLARSTSTALTDADLSAATDYCYQVVAIDASENASAPSAVVCQRTPGTGMVTARPPMIVDPPPVSMPPTGGPGSAAALLALDVRNLPCDLEVESSNVATALTLDAPCYRVPSGLTVAENGRLTIAPGTVLKFGSGRELRVNGGGSLSARGTAERPIVFAGLDPTPGFWNGVRFVFSNSSSNVLENVLVEQAGNTSGAALTTQSSTSSPVRLAVRSVALRQSAGAGFSLASGTILDEFSDVVSTGNARAGEVEAGVAGMLSADLQLTGNELDALTVPSATVDRATSWPAIGVPWLVDDLTLTAPFEIPAGAELRFASGSELRVNENGSLRALGTADAPILLTGREGTPGFWDGVHFVFSNSVDNRLAHVTIEFAGSSSASGGALRSLSGSSSPVRISAEDVTLSASLGAGFRFGSATTLAAFERVTSTGNEIAGVLHPDSASGLGGGLALEGNTDDTVHLLDATLLSAATWPALGVPYRFGDLTLNAPLTLSAGTTMLADGGAEIRVNSDGALNAVGTAAQPIVFAGSNPMPGHWDGIYFVFSASPQNRIEHVEIRHGGLGTSATSGNVRLLCGGSSPSRVSIANAIIADSAGWGVFRSTSGCTVDVGAGTTFSGNAEGDINPI